MANRLGFAYRPISEIQKIKELYEAIQFFRDKKADGDSSYDTELFNEMLLACEDLRQQIHMKKE